MSLDLPDLDEFTETIPTSETSLTESNFPQIRQDLARPTLLGVLRQDPAIRSKMTPQELAAFDTILTEVGTPDEYSTAYEYVLRALPYVKLTHMFGGNSVQPTDIPPDVLNMIMRPRFLL